MQLSLEEAADGLATLIGGAGRGSGSSGIFWRLG